MKQCNWCELTMYRQNIKKHLGRCTYKNEIGLTKTELRQLKTDKENSNINNKIKFTYSELRDFLTESYNRTMDIYAKVMKMEDPRDPLDLIKEMQISEGTKKNYITEWNRYSSWMEENNKLPEKDSADTYLASLKNIRASTLRQKQGILQTILQIIVNKSIKLNKIKQRISYVPKYALNNEEIDSYLEEQIIKSKEDYLIQRFMITYGLRINSIALLKIKHLEFLKKKSENIIIPDSKVKRFRTEKIDKVLVNLFIQYLNDKQVSFDDEEEYVFYRSAISLTERDRAHHLCVRINNRIKNSKVLNKKSKNYKYTSHMFRKTKAFNMFNTEVEQLKERVRASIGQSQGSTALESYIHMPNII